MTKDKKFYASLLMIALPFAFQNLISVGVNLLDNMMVSSLGDITFSAATLSNNISIYMMMIVRGLCGGSAMMISQYLGKNDFGRIKIIFGIGMKSALVLSFIVTLVIQLFPYNVVSILTNDEQIRLQCVEYLKIVSFSYLFYAVSETLIGMLRSIQVVIISLIVSIISFFTNFFGNYILIFGKFGFPELGLRGAAIATVFSRFIEIIIVLIFIIFFEKKLHLKLKDILHNDKIMWKDYLKYSTPIAGGDMLWGLVGLLRGIIIGHLSSEIIAAYGATDLVMQLSTIFIFGLSSGGCVLIGKTVGAKDYKLTKEYSKTLQIIFGITGFFFALIVFFTRGPIINNFFDISNEAKIIAMQFLLIGAFSTWATSYAAACFVGINRGSGDAKFVVKTDLVCGWLIVLPLSALSGLVLKLPPPFIFMSMRIDQFIKVFIAYFRLNKTEKWIKNVTRD